MPHAELKYSTDLALDAPALLREVEAVILRQDPGSGACKGRAYPAEIHHHSHALLSVAMLAKPHRDAAFSAALLGELKRLLQSAVSQEAYLSVDLSYAGETYWTGTQAPDV